MRLGQLTRVAVPDTDLTLLVRVCWGEYKQFVRAMKGADEAETLEPAEKFLRAVLADVRGLTDEAGEPVQWTADLLDQLDPATVLRIVSAVVNIGEAGSGDPLPATASGADSDAAPAG